MNKKYKSNERKLRMELIRLQIMDILESTDIFMLDIQEVLREARNREYYELIDFIEATPDHYTGYVIFNLEYYGRC